MSLVQYRKKRKFKETPEPRGSKQATKGPLTFVVQKHEASRLHYDFRLELDGVLKSWAVPKGPSMNPEDKRLAMMVEDHPLDYAHFEGIIPKGNYGAGTVMVWDEGVYSPYDAVERKSAEKILREQLDKGHLTFILLGKKLQGEFALVKTKHAEENAWLLIKKGDEYASTDDILQKDHSVLTKRSMDEIANQAVKKKEVWFSKPRNLALDDAPREPLPQRVKPMLAETVDEPFDKPNWLFEMKWDGYRAIVEINAGKVQLYSRNFQPFTDRFAPVTDALTKFPGNAVLDGEIVVVDKTGKPMFQALQDYPKSTMGELRYYVFDILHLDGHDIRSLPLRRRKELLKKVLPPLPHIFYSDHIEEFGEAFFREAVKHQLEGVMAKNAASKYQPGVRSHEWLKIKTAQRQEAIIAGFTKPRGGRKYFGSLVLGIYKKGKLQYIGHSGGGFDDQLLENLYHKFEKLKQDTCPFEKVPETNSPATWIKPILVCDVTFSQWTKDGMMRHPVFIGLRDDKHTTEVREERYFAKNPPKDGEGKEVKIGKQKIKLTNLTKVFWPYEGYTKGDVIQYYREIAPVILPYLIDRPQSLLRFPDGIDGQSFFQKNVGNLKADWIKTMIVRSDSEERNVEYMLCQNEASLIYMINLGCIDLNPWNSRSKHMDYPDYLLLDLDPEDVQFTDVITVALAAREVLESLEIHGYCKTSGARGMHIYIPLGAKYTYEQTRQLAELICIQIHKKVPEITSMVRSPGKRQGKVYLDFLQNRKGQTLASVYSIRPQPGAPVSTPLHWDELTSKLHPSQFTMKNTMRRLHSHGDLFKPLWGHGINMEKVLKKLEALINK